MTYRATGVLRLLRGDGSLVRMLLIALFLQIAVPLLGLLPMASASPALAGGITVCTAHGIVTMVPDGQGGWIEASAPSEAGLSCSFCLPLLSGNIVPAADLIVTLPIPAATPTPVVAVLEPLSATPPGSFSPRAPPLLR